MSEAGCPRSAWLKDTADPVVRALELRMAAVTGLDLRPPYAEYLQVVNYGLGGHYEPHFDHATVRRAWGGPGVVNGVGPGWCLGREVPGLGPWLSLESYLE